MNRNDENTNCLILKYLDLGNLINKQALTFDDFKKMKNENLLTRFNQ